MINDILADVEERMKKSIASMQKGFGSIRTGRANPAMFDGVSVDVYGSMIPLSQVATISCPEPRLVVIQPWDKGNMGGIEKAILKSELSLNPANDGNLIRIQIPELTEERRKEYVKVVKQKTEDTKVSIRNIRRDGNEMVKSLLKDKEISEDESKDAQDLIQKVTDKYVDESGKLEANKEKEILSI